MSISAWTEKWLVMLALVWGVILALPGDMFAGIERYRLIAAFFPDTYWGLMLIVGGLMLLHPTSLRLRRIGHWLLCTIWLGMTVLSLLSTISPPAFLIASLLFVIAMMHVGKFWRYSQPPLVAP